MGPKKHQKPSSIISENAFEKLVLDDEMEQQQQLIQPHQMPPMQQQQQHLMPQPMQLQDSQEGMAEGPCRGRQPMRHPLAPEIVRYGDSHETPFNLVLKKDNQNREMEPIFSSILCPLVDRTIFENSGHLVRVFNHNLPIGSHEIGAFRLSIRNPENVPVFLYKNKNVVKEWAVNMIIDAARNNGNNICDDPALSYEEYSLHYTVKTLSDHGRKVFGGKSEVGIWVLHFPAFIEEETGRVYEDGSAERFHIIHAYVNMVPPAQRRREVEGGWRPRQPIAPPRSKSEPRAPPATSEGRPPEKKSRGAKAPLERELKLVKYGEEKEKERQELLRRAEEAEARAKKTAAAAAVPPFPALPPPNAAHAGGPTPWPTSRSTGPAFVY